MEKIVLDTIRNLREGRPVVWAMVTDRTGSGPRSAGSRMAVFRDGTLSGSVGGGRLEGDALVEAARLFENPGRSVIHFDLTGEEVANLDMICGGAVDLLLESISPDDAGARDLLDRLVRPQSEPLLFVTSLTPGPPSPFAATHGLANEQGSVAGNLTVPVEMVNRSLSLNAPEIAETAAGKVLLEPLVRRPRLVIFGGGHVSLELARVANLVDFRVTVMDDRAEFANRDRFPMAEEIILRPLDKAVEGIVFDDATYVAIITRGHLYDMDVLRQVIGTNARYIGMIGSRRKVSMIREKLAAEGVPQEKLDGVHAPIGIAIEAETPAEIAVSIVGEMIHAKNRGRKQEKLWHV